MKINRMKKVRKLGMMIGSIKHVTPFIFEDVEEERVYIKVYPTQGDRALKKLVISTNEVAVINLEQGKIDLVSRKLRVIPVEYEFKILGLKKEG